MAVYNEILAGRFNRGLQKFFGMKGPPPVPQLGGEITPSLPLFWGPECRYLEGWSTFSGFGKAGAVAAQSNTMQFRNPVGSNVVCIISKLSVEQDTTAGECVISQAQGTQPDLLTVVPVFRQDTRGQQNSSTIFSISSASVGNFPTQIADVAGFIADYQLIYFEEQEYLILPGDTLRLVFISVNVVNRANFIFRERALEESERT
jgi:hypothetical protein